MMKNGFIFSLVLISAAIHGGILGGPIAAIILAALAIAYGGLYWIFHLMNKHLHQPFSNQMWHLLGGQSFVESLFRTQKVSLI